MSEERKPLGSTEWRGTKLWQLIGRDENSETWKGLYEVPPGYVLVPVEPTEAMFNAGSAAHFGHERPYTQDAIRAGYSAMLKAAQP